jgi:nitrite reductase/ring-hydroxylating ferredoxin subunit
MNFKEVSSLQDIAPGTTRLVWGGTGSIVLCNVEGEIHALENSCAHAGAALSGGKLCGKVITCPAHGWRFDVTTGSLLVAPQMKVKRFPVKIEEGKIYVQVET